MVFRAKFDEDLVKKLTEPRYCYKFVHSRRKEGFKDQTQQNTSVEDSQAKKIVVDNNFNFLYDLIANFLNPTDALKFPEIQAQSLEEQILQKR